MHIHFWRKFPFYWGQKKGERKIPFSPKTPKLFVKPFNQTLWRRIGVFGVHTKPAFLQRLNALPGKVPVCPQTVVGEAGAASGGDDLGCLPGSLLRHKDGQAGEAIDTKIVFLIHQQTNCATFQGRFLIVNLLRPFDVMNFRVNLGKTLLFLSSHIDSRPCHVIYPLMKEPMEGCGFSYLVKV